MTAPPDAAALAVALRVLDAIIAGKPWSVSKADLDVAREAVAALAETRARGHSAGATDAPSA